MISISDHTLVVSTAHSSMTFATFGRQLRHTAEHLLGHYRILTAFAVVKAERGTAALGVRAAELAWLVSEQRFVALASLPFSLGATA